MKAWLLFAVPVMMACSGGGSGGADAQAGPADTLADSAARPVGDSTGPVPDGETGSVPDGRAGQDVVLIPVEPSPAYLGRKQEYLEYCNAADGPGGGIYGQSCRLAMGESTFNEGAIDAACEKVNARKDTADFSVAGLVRLLYLDRTVGTLTDETRTQIETTLLDFRYWFTEPGDDKMCYWTENHQALFHSGELLAGQLFPDVVFSNSGMTGADHVAHAEPLVERWLDERGRFGFSEWHSNVYFNEDVPALVNLVDFAESEVIRTKAAMVLDIVAFDLLNNYYKGRFATTHGRTYPSKFLDGLKDSTQETAWLLTGLGTYSSKDNFSGAFIATSSHVPSPLLEAIAEDCRESHEHRQRDSISVVEGPEFGIGYEETNDIVFWAGMAGLVAPEVINGTVAMLDDYSLWTGFLFGDIPEPFDSMLKQMAGTPELEQLAWELERVSRGIALESVSTYTYRTPDYQLSGAQDHKPAFWSSQTQMWQATLDDRAFVFTSFPANMEELGTDLQFGGAWIGGWMPRITMEKNVGVIQYRKDSAPLLDDYLTADYLHAFFPKSGFDEVLEQGSFVFGRKGDGYVALGSENPVHWSEDNDYELIADVQENVWVVELGSADESGSFEEFVAAVASAGLTFGEKVSYDSPSLGLVEVGWEGPFTVAGQGIDLAPYPRWDNVYCDHEFGLDVTVFEDDGVRLVFVFAAGLLKMENIEVCVD